MRESKGQNSVDVEVVVAAKPRRMKRLAVKRLATERPATRRVAAKRPVKARSAPKRPLAKRRAPAPRKAARSKSPARAAQGTAGPIAPVDKTASPASGVIELAGDSDGELLIPPQPTTTHALWKFIKDFWGINIPDRAVCRGHNSPMDYLAASFLAQDDLLIWANRGGGKTMLAALATLLDAMFHAPSKIRVLGGSFDQSDRLADYIRELLDAHPQLIVGRSTRSRVSLAGGSEIRMLAQSQRAVRGQHVQKIRCDEVDLFDEDVWKAVQFITRSHQRARGSIEVLSTLHRTGGLMQRLVDQARRAQTARENCVAQPPPTEIGGVPHACAGVAGYKLINWCLWEVIEPCPPQRSCGSCLLQDDCRGVARQGRGFFRIDDAIAIKARSSRAAWESEMLCRGPARSQWPVFSEFDPACHVMAFDYQPAWPLYRGIDFGYRSPLVCLWIQVSPGGCVHVLDEYVRRELPIPQHAAAIKARETALTGAASPQVAATYVDPAGRQRESTSGRACTDMMAAAGITCSFRASGIADGIELIRSALAPALGDSRLIVHPRCTQLIEAFANYHYPPGGSGALGSGSSGGGAGGGGAGGSENPVKDGPDHLIDALRYFFVNRMRPGVEVKRGIY